MKKTNAMRILEQRGITFTVVEYAWDEDHLDALSAAHHLGIDAQMIFKTIVTENGRGEYAVFCLPGSSTIHLKRARALTGFQSLAPIKLSLLKEVTGYERGGCSPIGMRRSYPTFIEESAQLHETIYVSAGVRGLQIGIQADDLLSVCGAQWGFFT
jgi:Cys-tRNA(Pro)/Cys-tRNA(Cys) deacylase